MTIELYKWYVNVVVVTTIDCRELLRSCVPASFL